MRYFPAKGIIVHKINVNARRISRFDRMVDGDITNKLFNCSILPDLNIDGVIPRAFVVVLKYDICIFANLNCIVLSGRKDHATELCMHKRDEK